MFEKYGDRDSLQDKHVFLNRVILWHGMLCYPMVWYAMGFICYTMRFVCYAMVYVVKDKHNVTYIIFFNAYEFYFSLQYMWVITV